VSINFPIAISGAGEILGDFRVDRAAPYMQREIGDAYWTAMDVQILNWLEERYEALKPES